MRQASVVIDSKDVSVKFLAALLGQCCLVGHKGNTTIIVN